MLISAALIGRTGRTGGGPAGCPGIGGSGRVTNIFSGCCSHSESGKAIFAPDGSKFRRIPESVDITIAVSSSKVALLKLLIETKFTSMNFCSSLMLVIEKY